MKKKSPFTLWLWELLWMLCVGIVSIPLNLCGNFLLFGRWIPYFFSLFAIYATMYVFYRLLLEKRLSLVKECGKSVRRIVVAGYGCIAVLLSPIMILSWFAGGILFTYVRFLVTARGGGEIGGIEYIASFGMMFVMILFLAIVLAKSQTDRKNTAKKERRRRNRTIRYSVEICLCIGIMAVVWFSNMGFKRIERPLDYYQSWYDFDHEDIGAYAYSIFKEDCIILEACCTSVKPQVDIYLPDEIQGMKAVSLGGYVLRENKYAFSVNFPGEGIHDSELIADAEAEIMVTIHIGKYIKKADIDTSTVGFYQNGKKYRVYYCFEVDPENPYLTVVNGAVQSK